MRSSLLSPRILALSAAALLVAGCGSSEENAENDSGASPHAQGMEGFFNPKKGETWNYRVQKEIPLDVELSPDDKMLRPERTDSGYLITFERVRTCAGKKNYGATDRDLTAMDILENDELLGHELYDIGPNGVFFRGWMGADQKEPTDLLEKGVRLASPEMLAGQSWESSGADPQRQFHFRVIERSAIEVPAGEFEAVRIQITSDHEGKGLKRTIWFAENIGIVKEESVYYGPQRTRVRETSELVHFTVPEEAPPAEESLVSLSIAGDPLFDDPNDADDGSVEDEPSGGDTPRREPEPDNEAPSGKKDPVEEGSETGAEGEADPKKEKDGETPG